VPVTATSPCLFNFTLRFWLSDARVGRGRMLYNESNPRSSEPLSLRPCCSDFCKDLASTTTCIRRQVWSVWCNKKCTNSTSTARGSAGLPQTCRPVPLPLILISPCKKSQRKGKGKARKHKNNCWALDSTGLLPYRASNCQMAK